MITRLMLNMRDSKLSTFPGTTAADTIRFETQNLTTLTDRTAIQTEVDGTSHHLSGSTSFLPR